jgi:DNA-binding PadR family transcriptional regulator
MGKGSFLGEFEQLVLLAVLRLGDEAYGLGVRREIQMRTGREVAIGAVYATLDRLEEKGLVASSIGEATTERGGRAKRLFRVTGAGQESLRTALQALNRMAAGVKLTGGQVA